MALANKIIAFKKHFDIESVDKDVEFMFIAIFQGKEYILNNQQNKDKFLTYKSMKFKKNTELYFYARLGLKHLKKKKLKKRP